MNTIPGPLYKKLVLTLLAGTGCFLVGLTLSAVGGDRTLLSLSAALLVCSILRAASFRRQIRSGAYGILEGTCTGLSRAPFSKSLQVILTDKNGKTHSFAIPKEYKISEGLSYRFYFRHDLPVPGKMQTLLESTLCGENLLGMEPIDELSPDIEENQS